ncbi:hypothetical protein [Methylacidimicrobium sp. AP8]|uniref:hypothetical protein n=1 Tax=Methylacidimicrobium sp. AP8 TaxID=2730359 RepID=UPI001F2EE315|nr:hypothetical protein [Methylacidimicrobium sp. AP8]
MPSPILKKTFDLMALVATAALAGVLLDRLLFGDRSDRDPLSSASFLLPPEGTSGPFLTGERSAVEPGRSTFLTPSGLTLTCPDEPYARKLGALALRQLEGRYWIGENGHLYLRAANYEYRSLFLRAFPGAAGLPAGWSWLAEIANFHGPEVWSSSRDISPEERRAGVQWKGGFLLLRRVLDPLTLEPRTMFRLFSYADRSWGKWRQGIVMVSADATLKKGRWTIQWRLEADAGRFVLGNDPGVHPEHASLFREPFFLLPVSARDLP